MQKKEAQSLPVYSIVEIVFDAAYLVFAVVSGIVMLAYAQPGSDALRLYGALALVLGGGDAFHLIPRIRGQLRRSGQYRDDLYAGWEVPGLPLLDDTAGTCLPLQPHHGASAGRIPAARHR